MGASKRLAELYIQHENKLSPTTYSMVRFGNVLGSNVFNILAVMGLVATVQRMEVPPEILAFDLWVLLGVTAVVIALVFSGARLSRPIGFLFLAGYAAFVVVQYLK